MGMYARNTSVPIDRSKAEIEKTLSKYGASSFAYMTKGNISIIVFEMKDRRIRFNLPMPESPSANATQASIKTYEQLCRSYWRSLALAVKAKLEAVECGITSFETEFLAHIVMPGGKTAGEWLIPQIGAAYENKKLPPLLLEGSK